jgi:hypothetical protein
MGGQQKTRWKRVIALASSVRLGEKLLINVFRVKEALYH